MSLWNSGDGETAGEVHSLKNKLNVQDAQLAAQQTQLLKQAEQLNEYQASLNDAIHKLNQETQRSLQLEKDLKQRTNDYQSQCVSSMNVELAATSSREAIKAKELEVKELQAFLDTTSRTSDENNKRAAKLAREKSTLEARVRELEAERNKVLPNPPAHRRAVSQPRSSSASDDRIKFLEKELDEIRSTFSQTEASLRSTSQKLAQTQDDLIRTENEKTALEKRMSFQFNDLKASLEDKEAELQLYQKQAGDGSREDELIKRIEEDEAKITTLESILRETLCSKAQMREMESRLADEVNKVMERDQRCIGLVVEKADALDQLAGARKEIERLTGIVAERAESLEMSRVYANLEPVSAASLQVQPDDATIGNIERLLAAIDRLRVERDDLRRDVQFLETESKFTIESLEAKLSASVSAVTSKGAMEVTQSRRIAERSALVATASAVVIRHFDFRYSQLQEELHVTQNQCADLQSQLQVKNQTIEQQADKIHALEVQLGVSMSNLHDLCKQRDVIESNFTQRELQWEEERQRINRLNQNNLEELGRQVQDLSRTLQNVESERDSLALQVTNLTSELHSTKQELANGESRYSSLQFQQLSTMSASEANRALRDQLKEMEMRVARRTEQIGIHQHDIRRLETNLRLQEERLSEMTVELETLATQKAAMVEDCADAREARDAALSRVETLEMELEALDGKSEQSDQALISLVAVFMETVSQAKKRLNEMRVKDANATDELRAVYDHQQTLLRVSEDDKRSLAGLQQRLQDSDVEMRQMGIALALSRTEVITVVDVLDRLKEEKGGAEARFRHLSTDIEQYEGRYAAVSAELEISRLETAQHTHRIADLEASHQQTLQELADAHETYKGELARLCDESREAKERLEKDLAALDSERLQALAESSKNAKRLQTELEQINGDRSQERMEHEQQMRRIETQLQTAEIALEELKDRMCCVTRELDESHAELGSLQKQKLSLQESMTNLEAELQRSISMTRFLESKFKECEETIAGLNSERDLQREELLSIEKSCKAAEVNLSLQSAQHKREMAELQKEVDALLSKPDLAAALVELEERNNEMEELLRKKCAEIEENDDKVLEILKDNKKLTTKVESLNRKVQNLQAKLSAAKASIPKSLPQASEPEQPSLHAVSSVAPPPNPEQSILSKSTPAPTSRAAFVGTTITRAKTPEVPLAHPTVFKAKSPDKHASPASVPNLEETEKVIGKKRRAPEDFEVCDSLPPQGFTIDSLPDDRNENRTPRVRRMLSGGLSGFTPVRRTHVSQASPKRASAPTKTSLIADVTNSPRGTSQGAGKGNKKSWLGKIRGTTSHSSARPMGSRKASERHEDLA